MIRDYLYAIGKYLSPSQRDEVLKEIEANLYDYLEENYGSKDIYSDIEIQESIMKLGNPKKVAEAYLDRPRVLIGSPLIDTYFLLLKIVIGAVSLGLTISTIITIDSGSNLGIVILNLFGQIWSAALSVVGIMTIVFASIYKYLPEKDFLTDEEWSVKDLEKAPENSDKVGIFDIIFEIGFSVLALIFFNGSNFLVLGESINVIPIFNKTVINNYLPLINGVLIFTIILNIYLLIVRKWQIITRSFSVILDVLSVFIIGIIAFNPNIFDFSKIPGISSLEAQNISYGVQLGIKIGFAVLAVIVSLDIFKHIKNIIKKKS